MSVTVALATLCEAHGGAGLRRDYWVYSYSAMHPARDSTPGGWLIIAVAPTVCSLSMIVSLVFER
jgi:hypothetical protein